MARLKVAVLTILILQITQVFTESQVSPYCGCSTGQCCVTRDANQTECVALSKVGQRCESGEKELYQQYCPCDVGLLCNQTSGTCEDDPMAEEALKDFITSVWEEYSYDQLTEMLKIPNVKESGRIFNKRNLQTLRSNWQKKMSKQILVNLRRQNILEKMANKLFPETLIKSRKGKWNEEETKKLKEEIRKAEEHLKKLKERHSELKRLQAKERKRQEQERKRQEAMRKRKQKMGEKNKNKKKRPTRKGKKSKTNKKDTKNKQRRTRKQKNKTEKQDENEAGKQEETKEMLKNKEEDLEVEEEDTAQQSRWRFRGGNSGGAKNTVVTNQQAEIEGMPLTNNE